MRITFSRIILFNSSKLVQAPMRASLFILLAVLLTACGQKGPLFLPEPSKTEGSGVEKDNRDSRQKEKTIEVTK